MKKFRYFFITLVFFGVALVLYTSSSYLSKPKKDNLDNSNNKIISPIKAFDTALFIPYWTLDQLDTDDLSVPVKDQTEKKTLLYFGITPQSDGSINKTDPGYRSLNHDFISSSIQKEKKMLVLRMINNDINSALLDSQEKQNKLINEVVEVALKNGFDGVVIDLEVSILPTRELVGKISVFGEIASRKLHAQNLIAALAIYGDTFYRARPYDLTQLSKHIDMFYLMAYDLHKAGGNPGPNFPLSGREVYGYDFESMTADFRRSVSDNQLTVVFGMYGYDWWVDEKRRPIRPAEALTTSEIKEKFLNDCQLQNCVVRRDEKSSETEINYVDNSAGFHIVWFEDEKSVEKKIEYLKENGIGSVAFWAAGYY